MITGLRPKTFESLQLNAGAFLKNFEWSSATDAATLKELIASALAAGTGVMGATRGGGTFVCTPDMRSVEADGKRSEFVGSTVNDGWTVKMTGTLLEITPENFRDALISADIETKGNISTVTVRTSVDESDYIPTLCWVGDTSRGFVLIEIDNALNLTGASFTFTDKGEGTLPFEFQAHQASLENQDNAPCRIVFFSAAATEP